MRRGRARARARHGAARTKRLFRRLFLRFRRRPSRTPPRSHPAWTPTPRVSRPRFWTGARPTRRGSPRRAGARASTARRRSRLGACVSRRLRSWPTFARATPTLVGARPVVRLVRRAARRHAQPPDQRHREDRVDEQAHVPPRGTVRALAPRLAFARTPAAHRSDESLGTTRRNGESIAATVDGKNFTLEKRRRRVVGESPNAVIRVTSRRSSP